MFGTASSELPQCYAPERFEGEIRDRLRKMKTTDSARLALEYKWTNSGSPRTPVLPGGSIPPRCPPGRGTSRGRPGSRYIRRRPDSRRVGRAPIDPGTGRRPSSRVSRHRQCPPGARWLDVQPRPGRRCRVCVDLVTDQGPVRPPEQLEQARRHSRPAVRPWARWSPTRPAGSSPGAGAEGPRHRRRTTSWQVAGWLTPRSTRSLSWPWTSTRVASST